MRSAARFHDVMTPSRSLLMIASSDESTSACSSAAVSAGEPVPSGCTWLSCAHPLPLFWRFEGFEEVRRFEEVLVGGDPVQILLTSAVGADDDELWQLVRV